MARTEANGHDLAVIGRGVLDDGGGLEAGVYEPLTCLEELFQGQAQDDGCGPGWGLRTGTLAGGVDDLGGEQPSRQIVADEDVVRKGLGGLTVNAASWGRLRHPFGTVKRSSSLSANPNDYAGIRKAWRLRDYPPNRTPSS